MARIPKRIPLVVTRDTDGGITVHDRASGVVLSIIATYPTANGPHGVTVEVYSYHGGDILASDITPPPPGEAWTVIPLRVAHHPTYSFHAESKA